MPKTRTLKTATAKAPVWDWPGRDLSSGQSRAGACQAGSVRARGRDQATRTLSDSQSVRVRQQPRSSAGALRGVPAEVGVEETACGLRPGRKLPPLRKMFRRNLENHGAESAVFPANTVLKTVLKHKSHFPPCGGLYFYHQLQRDIGAPGTIRTSDPQIRSLMLYPAELRALGNGAHRWLIPAWQAAKSPKLMREAMEYREVALAVQLLVHG